MRRDLGVPARLLLVEPAQESRRREHWRHRGDQPHDVRVPGDKEIGTGGQGHEVVVGVLGHRRGRRRGIRHQITEGTQLDREVLRRTRRQPAPHPIPPEHLLDLLEEQRGRQ